MNGPHDPIEPEEIEEFEDDEEEEDIDFDTLEDDDNFMSRRG